MLVRVGLVGAVGRAGGGSVDPMQALVDGLSTARAALVNEAALTGVALRFEREGSGAVYWRAGVGASAFTALSGAVYGRAGDRAFGGQIFAGGTPRLIGGQGLRVTLAATNIIRSSATMATQTQTVTAVAHTLSFIGTGSITLSGASTAGPLNGTGASNRVSLTFTPSAGSLTMTVSGDVREAQLETGSAATDYVPNASPSAAATAAGDDVRITGLSLAYPLSLIVTGTRAPGADNIRTFGGLAVANGNNDRAVVQIGSSGLGQQAYLTWQAAGAGIADFTVLGATAVGDTITLAARLATNDARLTRSGGATGQDTSCTPINSPTTLHIGRWPADLSRPADATISSVYLIPRALSDAELITMAG